MANPDRPIVHAFDRTPTLFAFTSPRGFSTQRLAHVVHSLVRVSRRVGWRYSPQASLASWSFLPQHHDTTMHAFPHRCHDMLGRIAARRVFPQSPPTFHRASIKRPKRKRSTPTFRTAFSARTQLMLSCTTCKCTGGHRASTQRGLLSRPRTAAAASC